MKMQAEDYETDRFALGTTLEQMLDEADDCGCDGLDTSCLYCHAEVQVFLLQEEGVI